MSRNEEQVRITSKGSMQNVTESRSKQRQMVIPINFIHHAHHI